MMPEATDPTFYRSPGAAIAAPPEELAYVAAFDPSGRVNDAMAVIDCAASSPTCGSVVGWADLPDAGNELHHFGWNACSSALCHPGHGDHEGAAPLERRYLVVPGVRSSRIHLLDHDTFDVVGQWELDRGDQFFSYDVWWHLDYDTVITSEWGTPSMIENGLSPEDLLGRKFGHHLDFWSMSERRLVQRVDLGDAHQMVLELRPAHDPSKAYGFVGVVISVDDLSASVWLWHQDGDRWAVEKVITIPPEPADPDELPPALKPFSAVPPLISDIDLSVDDRWLYVSCWGTGERKQYDVTDPFNPRETGSVRLGGIVRRESHPAAPELRLSGAPQMVEISRDGKRVFITNSLYAAWDDVFYPDGVGAWMAKLDADIDGGGLSADADFFPHGDDFRGMRVHQTRLQGGDASSD